MHNSLLHFQITVTHKLMFSFGFSLRSLITSSNSELSSVSGLTSPQAGDHLTPTSYSFNHSLRTQFFLVIYSLVTDRAGNISYKSSYIVVRLLRSLPNNGRLHGLSLATAISVGVTILAFGRYASM